MASAAAITKRLSLDIGRLSGLLLVKTKLITNRSSDDNDTWFDIQAWKMWSLLHNNGGSLKGRNLNPVDPRPGQASGRGEAMMMVGRGKGWDFVVELETKIIRRFPKISKSLRRPLPVAGGQVLAI